jgi:hypothetical protein
MWQGRGTNYDAELFDDNNFDTRDTIELIETSSAGNDIRNGNTQLVTSFSSGHMTGVRDDHRDVAGVSDRVPMGHYTSDRLASLTDDQSSHTTCRTGTVSLYSIASILLGKCVH